MRREFVCVRHSISKLEPITGRKSETAIPRNIDGSRIGKTIRRSILVTRASGDPPILWLRMTRGSGKLQEFSQNLAIWTSRRMLVEQTGN